MSREPQLQVTEVTLHLEKRRVLDQYCSMWYCVELIHLDKKACETDIRWFG